MVCGDEQAVYADKAYAKRARRAWLASLGIKPRIMHKSWWGSEVVVLGISVTVALIGKIRAEVEGVFGHLGEMDGLCSSPLSRPPRTRRPS